MLVPDTCWCWPGERPHASPGQPQGSLSLHATNPCPYYDSEPLAGPCRCHRRARDSDGRQGGGTYVLASLEHVSGRELRYTGLASHFVVYMVNKV
jgi:hypothetical protein